MDRFIDAAMRPVADLVSAFVFYSVPLLGADVPLIVVWLVAGGVFFTVYLRFVNVRGFLHAIRVVSGRYKAPGDPGEVSQFQALTTAVSGTVGIGNVAGVAVAISIGGPGATFWLIVSGLLGMSTKFAECTLGVLYRRDNPDGSVSGGPMYYLERGLAERRWPRLGKALGAFYAASMVIGCLGIGSMFQSNQATAIVVEVTGSPLLADNAWLVGTLLAVLVGLVIVGGIRTIASTTVRLVPTMALLYVVSALVIIALNADRCRPRSSPSGTARSPPRAWRAGSSASSSSASAGRCSRTRPVSAAPPSPTPRRGRRNPSARGSSRCSSRSSTPS